MAYIVDSTAPRVTHKGRTFAIDFVQSQVGYALCLFESDAGGWIRITGTPWAFQLSDQEAAIGPDFEAWWKHWIGVFNAKLQEIFGASSTPTDTTTIDGKIRAKLKASRFEIINDVPQLV